MGQETDKGNFSVLMSLYSKEKPEYFRECMKSILKQALLPSQIIIVKDGPLTDSLDKAVEDFRGRDPDLYTIVPIAKNGGLGPALAKGIQYSKYELVARMDTDDVAVPTRFEKQYAEFKADPSLDICGSNILEFDGRKDHIVAKREVPLTDKEIKAYQRKRDAFNHMTVMYKKSAVLRAGNYQSVPLMEDTMLWVRMMQTGAKCKNIKEPLVYARVGKDMFSRRGGWSYFKKYRSGRLKVLQTGYISRMDYLETVAVQFVVALIPGKMRETVFKKILHR